MTVNSVFRTSLQLETVRNSDDVLTQMPLSIPLSGYSNNLDQDP